MPQIVRPRLRKHFSEGLALPNRHRVVLQGEDTVLDFGGQRQLRLQAFVHLLLVDEVVVVLVLLLGARVVVRTAEDLVELGPLYLPHHFEIHACFQLQIRLHLRVITRITQTISIHSFHVFPHRKAHQFTPLLAHNSLNPLLNPVILILFSPLLALLHLLFGNIRQKQLHS